MNGNNRNGWRWRLGIKKIERRPGVRGNYQFTYCRRIANHFKVFDI